MLGPITCSSHGRWLSWPKYSTCTKLFIFIALLLLQVCCTQRVHAYVPLHEAGTGLWVSYFDHNGICHSKDLDRQTLVKDWGTNSPVPNNSGMSNGHFRVIWSGYYEVVRGGENVGFLMNGTGSLKLFVNGEEIINQHYCPDPLSDATDNSAYGEIYLNHGDMVPIQVEFDPIDGADSTSSAHFSLIVWEQATPLYGSELFATPPVYSLYPDTIIHALPPWACACPVDHADGGSGCPQPDPQTGGVGTSPVSENRLFGPSSHDPVNVATGTEYYLPDPDLAVYNPDGPPVQYQRAFYSSVAKDTDYLHSNGLSSGWVHNYDMTLQPDESDTWSVLHLHYPKDTEELISPILGANGPTGDFTTPTGAPYLVHGIPDTIEGVWRSITITFKDQTQWQFTPWADSITYKDLSSWRYNPCWNNFPYLLTRISNRTGKGIDLHWDISTNIAYLSTISNDKGVTLLTCNYDNQHHLASVMDNTGRKVVYTFTTLPGFQNTWGYLTSVSQISDSTTQTPPALYTYGYVQYTAGNHEGLLSSITVPSDIPNPQGVYSSTAIINYDSSYRVASQVDGNGNSHEYHYDTNSFTGGATICIKDASGIVQQQYTHSYLAGQNTGISDANGKKNAIAYGDLLNPYSPTTETQKDGKHVDFTYDQYGNILTATSVRGVLSTFTYDYSHFALGRVSTVTVGSHTPSHLTYYEPIGLLHTMTRAKPGTTTGETTTTTYMYDELGNTLTVTGPGNNAAPTITTTYNYTDDGAYHQDAALGEPLTVADNTGKIVRHYRYDTRGNCIQIIDSHGFETDFTFNIANQLVETRRLVPGTGGTQFTRDINTYLYTGGPLLSQASSDENGNPTAGSQYKYGLEGELTGISGSAGSVSNTYDALYRPIAHTDGNNNATTYSYDTVGNLSQMSLPGGTSRTCTSFDDAGRILTLVDGNNVASTFEYDSDGQPTAKHTLGDDLTFTYTPEGWRDSMTDATGKVSYSYDDTGKPLAVTTHYSGLNEQTISYSYYPDGSRKTMTTPAGTFTYKYDPNGQLVSLTNPFGKNTAWSYRPDGKISRQTLGDHAWTTYGYDIRGRLATLTNYSPKGMVLSTYAVGNFDGANNRGSVRKQILGQPAMSGVTNYTYDSSGQLLEEALQPNGYTHDFSYDAAGNPTHMGNLNTPALQYNSKNQLIDPAYTYDGAGNPTLYNGNHLSFDSELNLLEYKDSTNVSLLKAGYNGLGLRAWKEVTVNGQPRRTYFLYDGTHLLCELNADGSVCATNTLGAYGLVARNQTWYQFDLHGNVAHRLDGSGLLRSSDQYDAWGNRVVGTDKTDPYGFKGQAEYYTDNETGLVLCTYRYLDPRNGRWLTFDPNGNAGGMNLYAYCANYPMDGLDPLGLFYIPGFDGYPFLEFDTDTVLKGLSVGFAGAGSGMSYGIWNGGSARCDPSFETSSILGRTGMDLLFAAFTLDPEIADFCIWKCFVAGTQVYTPAGGQSIESIESGDLVWSDSTVASPSN